VVATGEFRAAPAQAEEMYDPDVFGRSSTSRMKSSDDASGGGREEP
jgi:uncharacterized protein YfaS (alpha-2-macroglobulin family)